MKLFFMQLSKQRKASQFVQWLKKVACMPDVKNECINLVVKPGKRNVEDLSIVGSVILKLTDCQLKKKEKELGGR
jgi:hypothetical protein